MQVFMLLIFCVRYRNPSETEKVHWSIVTKFIKCDISCYFFLCLDFEAVSSIVDKG